MTGENWRFKMNKKFDGVVEFGKNAGNVLVNATSAVLLCASIGLSVVNLYKQVKATAEFLEEKKFIK